MIGTLGRISLTLGQAGFRRQLVLMGSTVLSCAIAATSVQAQELERGETVTERQRPEVDPLGARVGGFLVFPSLTLEEEYNDNIFAADDDEEADFITHLQPNLLAASQWNNHALNFRGGADVGLYADNTDENYEDYNFGFDGRYDISRNDNLFGGASFANQHEERGSPDDVNGEEPTEYDTYNTFAGGEAGFNRVTVRVTGDYTRNDYDDVETSAGATINNDDRDRDRYEARTRISYEIQENFDAFVEGAYNTVDYDDAQDDAGFNRDSDGYEAVVGTEFDLTGLTFGEVFAGWREQDYDDPAFDKISAPTVGLSLTSNITPLTTVQAFVQRQVQETTSGGASGILTSTAGVSVDHELLRNLILNANANYSLSDYEGIDREDDNYRFGLGARYLVNRYFEAGAGYDHVARESTSAGSDYTQNIFMIRGTIQY